MDGAITLVSGGTRMDEFGYTQVLAPGSHECVTELSRSQTSRLAPAAT